MTFSDWCTTQSPTPPPYSQSQSSTSTPFAPPSTRNPSAQQLNKEHSRGYTVCSCRYLSASMKDTWIYNTACTKHMTDQHSFFSTYEAFCTPVDVYGINGLLQALGQGDVIVTHQYNPTHTLFDVWYVPSLSDSIISKNWTKHSGLYTSMDENENFHLRSSTFLFPRNSHPRSTRKLFRVFSDICPISPESFGHCLYFIVFIDEATKYV
jgi:hypothetical protein